MSDESTQHNIKEGRKKDNQWIWNHPDSAATNRKYDYFSKDTENKKDYLG